ncbi:MAG: hypothetical protein KDD70_05335 [Bdellovibrionales bacterium]|nr:hypothetical protein [Bdellovibrionales bacterium]
MKGLYSFGSSEGQSGAAMVEYIPMVALFILLTVTALSAVGDAIIDQFNLVGETVVGCEAASSVFYNGFCVTHITPNL